MHTLFLSPALVIELFLNTLLFLLFSIAFVATLPFLIQTNKAQTQPQYSLQKRSHLIATLLAVGLFFKALLLPFFIYNLDKLSLFLPGVMCAAGVVQADKYGAPLVVLKIIIVLVLLLYGVYYKESQRIKKHYLRNTRHKLFILLYILLIAETVLSYLYYKGIPFNETLSCCSTLYKQSSSQTFSKNSSLILFYSVYLLLMITTFLQKKRIAAILSLLFVYLSYENITYFFSSYIYELPSHKCPYCILQSDYHYVGYFLYISLFSATFYTLSNALFKEYNEYKRVLFFYTFFVMLLSYYFFSYLIKNDTFLW